MKTFPTILSLLLTTVLSACTTSNTRQNIVQDPSYLFFDNLFWSRGNEPASLEPQVELFREQNLYSHSAQADDRLSAGECDKAITHLRIALEQKHNEYYFYHQMAIANQHVGDADAAEENIGRARRYARGSEKARFSGKLKALEALAITGN